MANPAYGCLRLITYLALGCLLLAGGIAPTVQAASGTMARADAARSERVVLSARTRLEALHLPPSSASPVGGVIVLHRADGYDDQAGLVRDLRLGLARDGWHTLSVQLRPLRGAVAAWQASLVRDIKVAVKFFSDKGVLNVVIAAHGTAAGGAAAYFRAGADAAVTGFIGVSPLYTAVRGGEGAELSDSWPKQILELFGRGDYPGVKLGIELHRRQVADLPDITLQQVALGISLGPGVSRQAQAAKIARVKRIRGWLRRNLAGDEAKVDPSGVGSVNQ